MAGLTLGCTDPLKPTDLPHQEMNAMYYWKTVFDPDSTECTFLTTHHIGRIYLRLFDVVVNTGAGSDEARIVPNATVRFPPDWYNQKHQWFTDQRFVPVIYITLDALKQIQGEEEYWGAEMVTRVQHICSYHQLPQVCELQLDCDWTSSTEASFFQLCRAVQAHITRCQLPWQISSTIRLHQLARPTPPVDRGVLMVYNTGSFDNPDARNSILDAKDVQPYMQYLSMYPLHLDVAYPTYSWQLLFRSRQFAGLLQGVNVADSIRFAYQGNHTYVALTDLPYNGRLIRKNDRIRTEQSTYAEIVRVKSMIEQELADRPHSTILYHLDSHNLSHYSTDEIQTLFTTCTK